MDVPLWEQLSDATGVRVSEAALYEYGFTIDGEGRIMAHGAGVDAELYITRMRDGHEYRELLTYGSAVELISCQGDRDRARKAEAERRQAERRDRELAAAQSFVTEYGLGVPPESLLGRGLTTDRSRLFIIEREDGTIAHVFKQYVQAEGIGMSIPVGSTMNGKEFTLQDFADMVATHPHHRVTSHQTSSRRGETRHL